MNPGGINLKKFSGNIPVTIAGYLCNISWTQAPSSSLNLTFSAPALRKAVGEKLGLEVGEENEDCSSFLFLSSTLITPNFKFKQFELLQSVKLKGLICQVLGTLTPAEVKTAFLNNIKENIMNTVELAIGKYKEERKALKTAGRINRVKPAGNIKVSVFFDNIKMLYKEINETTITKLSYFRIPVIMDNTIQGTVTLDFSSKLPLLRIGFKNHKEKDVFTSLPKSKLEQAQKDTHGVIFLYRSGDDTVSIPVQSLFTQITDSLSNTRDRSRIKYDEAEAILKENYPVEVFEYGLSR